MDKLLLRVPEAAESTGLSRSTIYELISSGDLPSVKVGRVIRVRVDALREWVQNRSSPAPSAPN